LHYSQNKVFDVKLVSTTIKTKKTREEKGKESNVETKIVSNQKKNIF